MATPRNRKSSSFNSARDLVRRSEDHFRLLVAEVEEYAILLLDPDGKISTWNAGAERLSGYTSEEAVGLPGSCFYTPEAIASGTPARQLEQAAGSGHLTENGWCVRKDGTRFWSNVTITSVSEAGTPRCFLVIVRDLTSRREMEHQLRQAVETAHREADLRLHESEERFSRFAQHLPGLAWIKDLNGRYLYINQAGARAFGKPVEEIYGRTDAELFSSETAAQFREHDRLALERRTGIEVVEHLTLADGTVHHSIVSKFPILSAEGAIQLVGGIAIDITERVRAEEALLLADRRKDEFLATLSHELRNPLAPLRNSLHVLRSRGSDARTERMYDIMEQQLNRMIRLVDDLLEVSRITGGKISLRKEPVPLATVLESAIETSRPLIEAASHRLTVELPAEPLVIDADPVRMTQVISNLLNNAAKYTQEGGEISLSARRIDGEVVLSVRDNGLGIPDHMLPRVFEMFAQVDRTLKRAQGGLGIGLSLARSLVEMHGGRIDATSGGLNQGSEFTVRLPLSQKPPRIPPVPSPSARPEIGPGEVPRVLVVDDNQDGADSLAMVLRTLGAEPLVAYNGLSALDVVRQEAPAIVLLDLGMPGMDGYEVAAQIRSDPDNRDIRLVALTGYGSEEERRRSRQAGFDDHCVKPVDPARLRVILATKREPEE